MPVIIRCLVFSPTTSTLTPRHLFVLYRIAHHKSQWNWNQPIEGEFPEVLTRLFRPYLEAFRPQLVLNRQVQTFFVNGNGQPFTAAGLTVYYSNM